MKCYQLTYDLGNLLTHEIDKYICTGIVNRQRLFLLFWIAYTYIIPWGLAITKCSSPYH